MKTTEDPDIEAHWMEITLRRAVEDDAAQCGAVCFQAFAQEAARRGHRCPFDSVEQATSVMSWLISAEGFHTLVAEVGGQVVGSGVLYEGGTVVAGIPVISVDPAFDGEGVGGALMRSMVERAAGDGFASVSLLVAAHNRHAFSLYSKLGFEVREPIVRLDGQPPRLVVSGYDVRPAGPSDAPECDALCTSVHGHDRAHELQNAIDRGTARVVVHEGRITGYMTVLGGGDGHAVGKRNEDLEALIASGIEQQGLGFHVPARNTAVLHWCLSEGLRVGELRMLMSTGPYHEPAGAWIPSATY